MIKKVLSDIIYRITKMLHLFKSNSYKNHVTIKTLFFLPEPDELGQLFLALMNELPEVNQRKRNVVDAKKSQLLCFETEFCISLFTRKLECWESYDDESKIVITRKINTLTRLLKQREKKITEQEMKSFELELKRIHRLFDLLVFKSSYYYARHSMNSTSLCATDIIIKKTENILNSLGKYDGTHDEDIIILLSQLKKLINSHREISNAERSMIHAAMASSFRSIQKTGHWFKCKNGHIYCITECGGAMEMANCPVRGCGEKIGGANHNLRQDQTLASEMDGATYGAWSDQNNMANFGIID